MTVKLLSQSFINEQIQHAPPEVLPGLPKGSYGFIIGPPDTGKSHFSLSLAYELTSGIDIVGLAASKSPCKVLYWSAEDSVSEWCKRVKLHCESFSEDITKTIYENLQLWTGNEPLVSLSQKPEHNTALAAFIDAARNVDLVIIDTMREVCGGAHEVKDDKLVKHTLQHLCRSSNAAVLATHHPTKETIRGNDPISAISGSGFSETLANSRYQLYLEKRVNKQSSKTLLSHIKSNFVPPELRIGEAELCWTQNSLIVNQGVYNPHTSVSEQLRNESVRPNPEESVPRTIEVDESKLSSQARITEHTGSRVKSSLKDKFRQHLNTGDR